MTASVPPVGKVTRLMDPRSAIVCSHGGASYSALILVIERTDFCLGTVRHTVRENDSYQSEVTQMVEAGWQIETETPERVTLVKRNFGSLAIHLIIAIVTLWWAMGIPNLLYAGYKYVADSERTIIWKEAEGSDELDA